MNSQKRGLLLFVVLLTCSTGITYWYFLPPKVRLDGIPLQKEESIESYSGSTKEQKTVSCNAVNINSSDSTLIATQLNIPSFVASRIVKYRTKIHAFDSLQQVRKIYGIEKYWDKIENCIVIDKRRAPLQDSTKTNINLADSLEIAKHVPKFLAVRIVKYRDKKGGFNDFSELRKIYGMSEKYFNALQQKFYIKKRENEVPIAKIQINQADSASLDKLPYISPKMASRIIKYRDLLGYFLSTDQYTEIWGMNDTILEVLKNRCEISPVSMPPINLNLVDIETFAKHPYVGKLNARLIFEYRKQHGIFKNIFEIQKIREVKIEKWNYFSKYFTVE